MNKKRLKSFSAAVLSLTVLMQALPVLTASGEEMTNDQYVYQFLTEDLNLHHAAASGIMANIDQECGFVPTASCIDTNGLISYGLMQWNGPRFAQMKSFCANNGYAYDTLEGQLAYLEYELSGPYSGYYDYLLYSIPDTAEGSYDAAYFWAERYEVCSSAYFERRALLARDWYYPAYIEYSPAAAVFMGEDFYMSLVNSAAGKALSVNNKLLTLEETSSESSTQTWRFIHQGNNTYKAVNSGSGLSLSTDGNGHLWYFHETGDGYMLRSSVTGDVLAYDENAGLQMQICGGSQRQIFTGEIKAPAKTPEKLNIAYSDAPSVTSFTWSAAENADSYRIKIYSSSSPDGTPYAVLSGITKLSCNAGLPAGTYTAVLESSNECGFFPCEPVTFTIGQQTPADLGKSFFAKISWNGKLMYLTRTENAEVNYSSASYQEDQLWIFRKNENGSYCIYEYEEGKILSSDEKDKAVLSEETDADQKPEWFIYGNEKNGYIISESAEDNVISAAEYSKLITRNFENASGQKFEISGYSFDTPVLTADAEGGVREPVKFSWNAADCADGYTLEVTDMEGSSVAAVKIRDNDTDADITLREGEYKAIIKTESSVTGKKAVSQEEIFSVKNLPERPEAGISFCQEPGMVGIYWNECDGADRYSYEVRSAETGEAVVIKKNALNYSAQLHLEAGEYILTVTAENAEGTISSDEVSITMRESSDGEAELTMKSILAAMKQAEEEVQK